MKFLDDVKKYFQRRKEELTLDRIEVFKDGYLADVYYNNGVSARVRTEKALRKIGVLD